MSSDTCSCCSLDHIGRLNCFKSHFAQWTAIRNIQLKPFDVDLATSIDELFELLIKSKFIHSDNYTEYIVEGVIFVAFLKKLIKTHPLLAQDIYKFKAHTIDFEQM